MYDTYETSAWTMELRSSSSNGAVSRQNSKGGCWMTSSGVNCRRRALLITKTGETCRWRSVRSTYCRCHRSDKRQQMLARYQMCRGRSPIVQGIRQDTRKHTRHCLRPDEQMVTDYLNQVTHEAWLNFADAYQALIAARFVADRRPFDALAELASQQDVYLGCSCPTKKNPNVRHCHTMLALEFMQKNYPELPVEFPT